MRVWLTGGSGFVGSNLIAEFRAAGDEVRAAVHRTSPAAATSIWRGDLLDADAVRADIVQSAPDVVVHAAIRNDLTGLRGDWRGAWADFVDATRNLVDGANAAGALIVLVSTDWVFDGTGHRVTEDQPPRPVNSYGLLKFSQERVVAERADRGAIARIAGVNGVHRESRDLPRKQDVGFGYLALSLMQALEQGRPFIVWDADQINNVATPSLASESARMIRRIGELGRPGIFHCCGADATTRRRFAEQVCEAFDLDVGLLRYGPPDPDALPDEPVPYDTSLDATATARKLDMPLLSLRELLARFREERAAAL
ncbi:MAG TPA: sugar nucleotide-binding protein [Jiangellaceae bacterium]